MTAPATNSIPGMALCLIALWAACYAFACAMEAPLRMWDDEPERTDHS